MIEDGSDLDRGLGGCSGCIPVLYALHHGNPSIAELLVKKGASFSGETCSDWTTRGYTPFHYAASYGYIDLLRLLLEASSKFGLVHLQSPVHPIHLAIAGGNTDCLKLILEYLWTGSDSAASLATQPTLNRTGEDRLDKALPCHQNVCDHRKVSTASKTESLGHVEKRYLAKLTELQIHSAELRWVWDLSSDITTQSISSGTPLHIASYLGNAEAGGMLLGKGAIVDSLDDFSSTPLHVAAQRGHAELVKLLLEYGANPNARDRDWSTPGILAASNGHLEILQDLKAHGADFKIRDIAGMQPLHVAARSGAATVFSYLAIAGYDINSRDRFDVSPLHYALTGEPNPLTSFVLNNAFLPDELDSDWYGILHFGFGPDNPSLLRRILKRLPKHVTAKLLDSQSVKCTPLYLAASQGKCRIMKTLLDAGAQMDLEGGTCGTPLMAACALGRIDAVKMLVGVGARVCYVKDGILVTALDAAKYHSTIIRWLLVERFMEHPKLLCNR